jgi:hypothetical protein
MPLRAERGGEAAEVFGPLGEDQAVPSATEGGEHIGDDLCGAGVVGDEVAVDRGHPAGGGRLGVAVVAERGGEHVQHGSGAGASSDRVFSVPAGPGTRDVADRAQLQADEVVQLVAPEGVAVTSGEWGSGWRPT